MSWSARSTTTTASSGALGCEDHLQHLVGVFKKLPEFISLRSERFGGQLCGHFDPCHRRVFRHVTDLVHLNTGITTQSCLELLSQCGGLRVSARKCAHESRKLRLGQPCGKVNAGDTRGGQQLRKAFFSR
jgi:hypothetical protein